MPTRTFTHPLFGLVTFTTKHPTWVRGDQITFDSGFDPHEVTPVFIPQLVGIPEDGAGHNPSNGMFRFHRRGHNQLLAAFADIQSNGLLKHIKSCAGAFNMRLMKPTSGALSKSPSNHAFGIAIDLNSDDGSNGASVSPVAPCFQNQGFRWGISFNDPMHFEVSKFIDSAKPSIQGVTILKGGVALDVDALNVSGHVMIGVRKAAPLLGFVIDSADDKQVSIVRNGSTKTFKMQIVADSGYVMLMDLAVFLGLSVAWDNAHKTAILS